MQGAAGGALVSQPRPSSDPSSMLSNPRGAANSPTTVGDVMGIIGKGLHYEKQRPPIVFVSYDVKTGKKHKKVKDPPKKRAGGGGRKRKKGDEPKKKEDELIKTRATKKEKSSRYTTDENDETCTNYSITCKRAEQGYRHKVGIWNADSHLFIFSRASKCISIVSASTASRLHPAVLDESNLHHFLVSDRDSLANLSPLYFDLTVCVCVGAGFTGEREIEHEFWLRARSQLESLFDVTDIHVAVALHLLSEYAITQGRDEQAKYYATLGMVMLEGLGQCNSRLYLSLLMCCYFSGSHPSHATFWRKVKSTAFGQSFSISSATQIFESKKDSLAVQHHEQQDLSTVDVDNLVAELTVHGMGAFSLLKMQPDNRRLHLALEEMLTSLHSNWAKARHVFNPGMRLRFDIGLLVILTAIRLKTGNMDAALNSAILMIQHTQDPLFPCITHVREGTYFPLKVLELTNNEYLLQSLLRAVQPLHGGTFLDGLLEPFKRYLT